jgi:hypothetical protein
MQSAEERCKLLERYGGEQPGPLVAVLKSAVGILALVAIAAGPWLLVSSDGGTAAGTPPTSGTAMPYPNSMAESKRIFDERRQRHEARMASTPPAQGGAALAQELEARTSPGSESGAGSLSIAAPAAP